ncbi:DUF4260 domain-containing protein [Rhodoblastus acidophilus]|uniref:DUF4260 domain-containing protein n=1 Tax=Candidatus Rhodoblastus alkanivorans TaxID=2954117 RepID=A0ABS9Z9F9_9HYPH|nr:DUF4260 domain-containing protein [Candidatus Rhodoblastus alkanivorans]MCI4679818.1 DUF4260 domain-containing protein [Candidatus Rhodoblastus alkanivorans]MCI4684324.1 DUF4260 domain-containing protein [Candidatus Rhodoblastus alkanivorans]MDI4641645.1 DUF4260 domain-containing protein [Rhodoblastus acidophilus]
MATHSLASSPDQGDSPAAAATGAVKWLLRAEGALVLALATLAYHRLGGGWALFALLFLAPDLTMLGYLIDPRWGARVYNFGHTYLTPTILAVAGYALATPALYGIALIWIAHIGTDRLLGFGLKYPTGFGATHLGSNGRDQSAFFAVSSR